MRPSVKLFSTQSAAWLRVWALKTNPLPKSESFFLPYSPTVIIEITYRTKLFYLCESAQKEQMGSVQIEIKTLFWDLTGESFHLFFSIVIFAMCWQVIKLFCKINLKDFLLLQMITDLIFVFLLIECHISKLYKRGMNERGKKTYIAFSLYC